MLFSALVEDIRRMCNQSARMTSAVFYFSALESSKGCAIDPLQSLIAQLCWRQPSLGFLKQLYNRPNRSRPGVTEIRDILQTALSSHRSVPHAGRLQ